MKTTITIIDESKIEQSVLDQLLDVILTELDNTGHKTAVVAVDIEE